MPGHATTNTSLPYVPAISGDGVLLANTVGHSRKMKIATILTLIESQHDWWLLKCMPRICMATNLNKSALLPQKFKKL